MFFEIVKIILNFLIEKRKFTLFFIIFYLTFEYLILSTFVCGLVLGGADIHVGCSRGSRAIKSEIN